MWPYGREVFVAIYGSASGLGIGEATLDPVTILGVTYSIHQDGSDEVGTPERSGRWEGGTAIVSTYKKDLIPDNSEETSYPWSAEGYVTLTPYVWQETVSSGGAIRFPVSIQGTFSTSGTWITDGNRSFSSAAAENSGTHTVDDKVYCSSCDAEGETAEAIGGKAAHDMTTCEREDCDVEYRACDRNAKALHSICEGCNTWRCDTSTGKNHKIVACSGQRSNGSTTRSCGQEYWLCSSDAWRHKYDIGPCWECGDYYMFCASDDHVYHASCPKLGANGETCQSDGYYECQEHTCDFASNTVDVNFNELNFQVYETLEVTVKESDLYIVNLYIDGEYVTAAYPNSNGEAVLTKTFDTDDVGEHTVTIYMFYGNGSVQSTTYSELISVTD